MNIKKLITIIIAVIAAVSFLSCTGEDNPESDNIVNPETPETPETPSNPESPAAGSKILVTYFSCGGNTETVAKRTPYLAADYGLFKLNHFRQLEKIID